jgi:dCMP deaminase
LAVDAPTLVRFRRWQRRRLATECSPPLELAGELTDFLRKDDADYFGFPGDERLDSLEWDKSKTQREYNSSGVVTGSWRCQETADVRLHNNSDCLDDLANEIARLKLKEPDWLRPTWDTYFMRMAELASMRTNCMKRRVGAVIVRDHRVIATGYNGTPRGTKNCSEGGCQRCNHGARAGHALDACLCLHAEENAIIEAGRERCAGAILFTNLCPCLACTKKIVQAGIQEVVYGASYAMDTRSARLLAEANVYLRHYPCTWSRAGPHHHHLNSSIPLVSKDLAHLRLGR